MFRETGEESIRRELMEEIGVEATRVSFVGAVEDIFGWDGRQRREVFLVSDIELADNSLYQTRGSRNRRERQ